MNKIYKAALHAELEIFTRQGWQLEQVLNCDYTKNVMHTAPAGPPQPQSPGYATYSSPTVTVDSPVIVREPLFLLSLDAEFDDKVKALQQQVKDLQQHVSIFDAAGKVLNKQLKDAEDEANRRTKELGLSCGHQQKLSEANKKLENDLAKVCSAIGQLQYDKIVGGPVPTPKAT